MSEPLAIPEHAGAADYGTLLTLRDAAARLGVSLATARRWLKAGALDGAVQQRGAHGPEWFVPLATVESRLAGTTATKPAGTMRSDHAAELAAALDRVRNLEIELTKERTLAAERAQQLDQLHSTMRTLMLTAGENSTPPAPRRRWFRRAGTK